MLFRSLLTPIGNPQNILLWGRSGLSFAAFTWQMAPLALVDSTQELRLLPKESLPKLCDELRRYLLDTVAAVGVAYLAPFASGHMGWADDSLRRFRSVWRVPVLSSPAGWRWASTGPRTRPHWTLAGSTFWWAWSKRRFLPF